MTTAIETQTQSTPAAPWRELTHALRELNRQHEFVPLVGAALQTACRLFHAESAALLLSNRSTGVLDIAAVENMPSEAILAYQRRPARTACLSTSPVAANLVGDQSVISGLAAAGFPRHVIVPIVIQDKSIGCLTLAAAQPLLASADELARMELFLEYIAQAIENAYLIFHLRERNSRLELMMTKLQNTQNHLKRAEKMALVGKIAAAVAHEVRNPLTIINTSLQLAYEKMQPEHPERSLYEIMIAKVHAVDQTIKELMNFSRPIELRPAPLVLAETLAKVVTFVGKKFESRKLQLQSDLPADLPRVLLDNEQIQRIFLNLFLNSMHVLPEQGWVRVRAWREPGKPWVMLSFADSGPGITPEQAQHLFEPFFTTRPDGTGLGLFLIKHLLEEMNGGIELRTQSPQGAEFLLWLPVASEAASR